MFGLLLACLLAADQPATEIYELDRETGVVSLLLSQIEQSPSQLFPMSYSPEGAKLLIGAGPTSRGVRWFYQTRVLVLDRATGETDELGRGQSATWLDHDSVARHTFTAPGSVADPKRRALYEHTLANGRVRRLADRHFSWTAFPGVLVPATQSPLGVQPDPTAENRPMRRGFLYAQPAVTTGRDAELVPLPIEDGEYWSMATLTSPLTLPAGTPRTGGRRIATLIARRMFFDEAGEFVNANDGEPFTRGDIISVDVVAQGDDLFTCPASTRRVLPIPLESVGGIDAISSLRAVVQSGELILCITPKHAVGGELADAGPMQVVSTRADGRPLQRLLEVPAPLGDSVWIVAVPSDDGRFLAVGTSLISQQRPDGSLYEPHDLLPSRD